MRLILYLLISAVVAGGSATKVQAIHHQENAQTGTPFWYETITHNGISPTIPNGKNWTVFRSVKDYGAKGDGIADDTGAIQNAIFYTGDSTGTRDSGKFGSIGQPAVVYFPSGTYLIKSTLRSAIGTVLMGNPLDRPVLKAAASFNGKYLLVGHGRQYTGLVGFFHGVRDLLLDSTSVPGTKAISLLDWGVSQNNVLSNVLFNMPVGASSHTGISMEDTNSPLIMNDLQFVGGGVGVALSTSTQYLLKSLSFKNVQVGIKLIKIVVAVGQGLRFESCGVGIDASSRGVGHVNLIDSVATNTTTLVSVGTITSGNTNGGLMLENVRVDSSVSSTVKLGNSNILQGSVETGSSWIRGNVYLTNSTNPLHSAGQRFPTSRPQVLVDNSTAFYHTVVPPTYANYNISQVINVKDVPGYPVSGDGVTDDTANLQAIINTAAQTNQLVYLPHGIYLLSNTLFIPPNSKLVGEAWTQFSATGSNFKDPKRPTPMIKVGNPGDTGTAQMSDFIFTVADILPGAVLVEVNMAGTNPGDVGFFNCHFRVGGAWGSKTSGNKNCGTTPEKCMAARLMLHLKATSSSYWENTWAWTADHELDGGSGTTYPGPLGGFLVEAQKGTWILGAGIEHNALYQLSLHSARNILVALQQSETPYWQGTGNTLLPPAPWTDSLHATDPDFAWCNANPASAAQCRAALYQVITASSDVNIYGAALWNFVSGPQRTPCLDLGGTTTTTSKTCGQENAAVYNGGGGEGGNERVFVFGFGTMNSDNLIVEGGGKEGGVVVPVVRKGDNLAQVHDGFRPAVVAGYLRLGGRG